jgi:hypothetical protein
MDTLTLPLRIFSKKIEAACYNRGRLALLRLGDPLRVPLPLHRGLVVILNSAPSGYVLIVFPITSRWCRCRSPTNGFFNDFLHSSYARHNPHVYFNS